MNLPWGGPDKLLRWLRAISVMAFLTLVCVIVLDPARGSDLTLIALLSGAVLLQLGYEVVIPGITRRGKGDDEHD